MNLKQSEKFPLLPLITGMFVTILVLTPSAASKFIAIGPFNIVGATLFYPLSYLFNDILTEVYGYAYSRRIIWIGLGAQLFSAGGYSLIQVLPAPSFWHNQDAYDAILGQAPRIVFASIAAYFFGEFVNSFTLSRMKFMQNGKVGFHIASRFVLSTIFSEFVDSVIFIAGSFYGVISNDNLIRTMLTIWVVKSLYEVVMLPVTMPIVAWIKKREVTDQIDDPKTTNYTPFKL
jgi:uncharacterized integral membrane protein (TIGR00697 family)